MVDFLGLIVIKMVKKTRNIRVKDKYRNGSKVGSGKAGVTTILGKRYEEGQCTLLWEGTKKNVRVRLSDPIQSKTPRIWMHLM